MIDRLKTRVWDKVYEIYWTEEEVYENIQWLLYPDNDNINNVIVEQCTGLKDDNGKLIYEGDVIEYEVLLSDWLDETDRGLAIIYFDEKQCAFGGKTFNEAYNRCFGLNGLLKSIEVIGNIHTAKKDEINDQ